MTEKSRFAALQTDIEEMNSAARVLLDGAEQLDKASLNVKVTELTRATTKISMSLLEMNLELARKDEEIRELKSALKSKEEMSFDGHLMWKASANGHRDGPYCAVCFQTKRQEINLYDSGDGSHFYCKSCKNGFDTNPGRGRHVSVSSSTILRR